MVASRSADDEAPTSHPRGIPGPLSGQEATAGQGSSVSDLDQTISGYLEKDHAVLQSTTGDQYTKLIATLVFFFQ